MPAVVALAPRGCASSPKLSGTTLPQDGRLATGRRPVLLMQSEIYLLVLSVCALHARSSDSCLFIQSIDRLATTGLS